MESPGHVGITMVVYAPVFAVLVSRGARRLAWAGFPLVTGAALVPDVDLYLPMLAHRGPTHTVWAALVVGLAVWLVGVRLSSARPLRPAALATLGVLSHLLGDLLTPMGIRPFAPVGELHYSLALVAARNPTANAALFSAGLLVALLVAGSARRSATTTAPEPRESAARR